MMKWCTGADPIQPWKKIFRRFILEPADSRGGGEKRQIHIGVEVTAASPGTGERVVPKKCFQKGMKLFIM